MLVINYCKAVIGQEEDVKPIEGYRLDKRNTKELRLVDFRNQHSLVVGNTQ